MDRMWLELLVGVLLCAVQHSQAGPAETKHCCLPDQFQVTIGTHGGIPNGGCPDVYDVDMRVAYDKPNERWGLWYRYVYVTYQYTEWMYLEDYKTRQIMMVTGRSNIVLPMPEHFKGIRDFCIPENAEYWGSHRVGVGKESYTYDAYEWDFEYAGNLTARFHFRVLDDCTPITETAWFHDFGFNYTTYVNYFEMQGLDQWSPFDQYNKHYKGTRSIRTEWPELEEDAQRPWHVEETFHFIKRIKVYYNDKVDPSEFDNGVWTQKFR